MAGAAVFLTLALAPTASAGWVVSAGVFDTASVRTGEMGVEARLTDMKLFSGKRWALSPAFGLMGNFEGALYGYGGFRFDYHLSQRWILSVHTAAGWYEKGDSKDLGGPVEFRSGLEAARVLASGRQIGVSFYHLSNSSIYDDNPGSNSLVLTFAL